MFCLSMSCLFDVLVIRRFVISIVLDVLSFNVCRSPAKTYVLGIQKNLVNETVLLSTQNKCLN